jgi:hypothetical protein
MRLIDELTNKPGIKPKLQHEPYAVGIPGVVPAIGFQLLITAHVLIPSPYPPTRFLLRASK